MKRPGDDGPLPPGFPSLSASFDLERLAQLRRHTAVHARAHGLDGHALDGFVMAVNEIVANAIAHGGGCGELRLWSDGSLLRCEVTDNGPGLPAGQPPTRRPPLSAPGGRGLWMARQFCQVDIHTGPQGTTVELSTSTDA